MDLKVPVTAHAIGQGIGMRRSISNYMYNQTGHFADAGHAFAKALFFGGVTNRFPDPTSPSSSAEWPGGRASYAT